MKDRLKGGSFVCQKAFKDADQAGKNRQTAEFSNYIKTYSDQDGKFVCFDFYVTATRATAGLRYRSPLLWVKLEGYPKFYFDSSALANWQPSEGTKSQAVRVLVNEILNYIIRSPPT